VKLIFLSSGISFYQILNISKLLGFEKRDIILISGVLLFMIGLLGVGLNIVESVGISIAIYVGIKVFVGRRKKMLDKKIGEGFCVECGEKVIGKKCPNCDNEKK
jgi:hypothetical protein